MVDSRESALLGMIYDAPFSPELWGPAMELLVDELAAGSACMTQLDVITGEGGGRAVRVPDDTMDTYLTHWIHDNPLLNVADAGAYVDQWQLAIVRSEEWIDTDVLQRSGYFNEFLKPIASEHSMMIRLSICGTRVSSMNIARSAARGAFTDREIEHARRWQAHLVRADRIGRQIQIDQAALDAIDRLVEETGKVLFFLDSYARVCRMSAAAEGWLARNATLRVDGSRLVAQLSSEDRRMQQLIMAATGSIDIARRGGAMNLTIDGERSVELAITPLGPRSVAVWSDEPMALVSLAHEPPQLSSAAQVCQRHGLTPAESRVALALSKGRVLRDIAAEAGLSVNTVRAQLGTIFSKTGCHRQAELVHLLLVDAERHILGDNVVTMV